MRKIKLAVAFLLFLTQNFAYGQIHTLKIGEQFSYEYLRINKVKNSLGEANTTTYKIIHFLVLAREKGTIELSVIHPRTVSNIAQDVLSDSRLPEQGQEITFHSILDRLLSTEPFRIVLDEHGNLKEILGLEKIKYEWVKRVKKSQVDEKFGTPDFWEKAIFSPNFFKKEARLIFQKPFSDPNGNKNLVNHRSALSKSGAKQQFTDSLFLSVRTKMDVQSGMLGDYFADSVNKTYDQTSKLVRSFSNAITINRLTKDPELSDNPSLFPIAAKILDYDRYWKPQLQMARKAANIIKPLYSADSDDELEARLFGKVDSIDLLMKSEDFEYWAVRLGHAQYFGRNYSTMLQKVPYEYILTDAQIIDKIREDYLNKEQIGVKTGFQLLFKKFSLENGYPLNYKLMSDFIHNKVAADAFNTQNPVVLSSISQLIKTLENLNLQPLSELLKNLKFYVSLKATPSHQLVQEIVKNKEIGRLDRFGRYRLLIYDTLLDRNFPDSLVSQYLEYTIDLLKNKLSQPGSTDELSAYSMIDKILVKKYLADAYYRMSLRQPLKAQTYLDLAASYLADQTDQLSDNGYLAEEFVFLPKSQYDQMYVQNLALQDPKNPEFLQRFAEMVIVEPDKFLEFKKKYTQIQPQATFKAFFNAILESKLPKMDDATLAKLKLSKDSKGKYLFIDFWGTWCGTCLEEMHEINKLYVQNDSPNLLITTVACFDKQRDVQNYLAAKNYTFPVVVSDNTIEKAFNVNLYPTKILILPNHSYLMIPFSHNYKSIIDKYLAWEL